jgi:hypothetical protein
MEIIRVNKKIIIKDYKKKLNIIIRLNNYYIKIIFNIVFFNLKYYNIIIKINYDSLM